MDSNKNIPKYLETKIKLLEIENQKLASMIEANHKEIQEIKKIIQSLSTNDTPLPDYIPNSIEENAIYLDFRWKVNSKAYSNEDLRTVKKVSGGNSWNCSAIGDKTLIKGKINKWKIQVTRMTSEHIIIGIVPKNINIEAENNWKKGYCTNLENFYKHNLGVASIFASHKTNEGNIFEIIVDLNIGKLSFCANGKNLGVFCDNIIKDIDYVPFIEIYQEQTEITLL